MQYYLGKKAWIPILSRVFKVNICDKLDFIDIAWDDLNWALEGMDQRHVMALRARYEDGLTFEQVGEIIKRKSGQGRVSKNRAFEITNRAVACLRSFERKHVLISAIVAIWNLER